MLIAFMSGWLIRGNQYPVWLQKKNSNHATASANLQNPNNPVGQFASQEALETQGLVDHRQQSSRPGQELSRGRIPRHGQLFKTKDPLARMGGFIDILRNLDKDNIGEVLAAFESLPKGATRSQEMKLFFHAWARLAPMEALEYAANLDKGEALYAVRASLSSWAGYDAPEAMKWVDSHPDTSKSEEYMVGIIAGVATFDTKAATDLLLGMSNTNYRFNASSILAKGFLDDGIEAAIQWASTMPDGNLAIKSSILNQIASDVAMRNPKRCAEWALSMKEGEGRRKVLAALINYWTRESQQAPADWIRKFPEGDNKYYAIEQMVNQWAFRDPVSTANWLNEFPSSFKLDPAIDNFSRRIAYKDPATAAGWSLSIVDEKRRQNSLANVYKNWEKRSPQEAEAWARAHAPELLPPDSQN